MSLAPNSPPRFYLRTSMEAGGLCSVFGLQNTPHLVRDLKSGPESGPVARLCRHQTNFYIIITDTYS